MSTNGLGKTNIESSFEGYKYFKLRTPDPKKNEDHTEIVVRLIPAMKSYRDTGEWKFFYGQHYGYHGNNTRNPDKPRARPFGCIQKKTRSGDITVTCPKCVQMEKMRAQFKARVNELLKTHGIESDEAPEFREIKKSDAKLKTIGEWLRKHNCDKKFWMNVMAANGEFGVLQLSYETTMNVLLPYLKKLRDEEKVDAFDPGSGIWLKFTRTGVNPRVKDTVEAATEVIEVQGKKARVQKTAPLTDEQIEKALKICPDLAKEVVKFIPAETIQKLVDCNGDPDEVDKIWPPANEKKTEKQESAGVASAGEEAPKDQQKQESAPQESEEDLAEAALMKQMEELKAKRAAKAKAAEKPSAKLPEGNTIGREIDNADDFLDQFEPA